MKRASVKVQPVPAVVEDVVLSRSTAAQVYGALSQVRNDAAQMRDDGHEPRDAIQHS